jgi:N-methylhydantoinase A
VLLVSTATEPLTSITERPTAAELPPPMGDRQIVDTASGERLTAPVYARETLQPGMRLAGPAVIVEQDTATVVSARFSAYIHPLDYIILEQPPA